MAITLKIEGMHCGGCVRSVEKAAAGVAGVRNVKVDLDKGEMTADLDRPDLLPALASAIEETGFDVVAGR